MMHTDDAEFGDDLSFTHLNPRPGCAGTWIAGRVAGHRFEALVFRDHAEDPAWELGDSRISKLWVQRLADRTTVVNFDRGWDIRPTDDLAARIADFLAAGLAEHVFGS